MEIEENAADAKDVLTSEEKRGLNSKNNTYKFRLDSIMEKFGSQDRLEIDRLDSEICAQIEGIHTSVDNMEKAINLEMSKLKRLQEVKGYETLMEQAPPIKETVGSLKTVIKGMIQQIQFLNIALEYLNAEKTAVVEKIKTHKNSEVVLQVISETKKMNKENMANMEQMYHRIINRYERRIAQLEGSEMPDFEVPEAPQNGKIAKPKETSSENEETPESESSDEEISEE